MSDGAPHLPRGAPIDAYGKGGFRFAGMSHRGSLLCLPNSIRAWPVQAVEEITENALAPVFAASGDLDLFLIGTGQTPRPLPDALRWRFRDLHIGVDVMPTAAAVRTYNVLFAEARRVGAGLIAVD